MFEVEGCGKYLSYFSVSYWVIREKHHQSSVAGEVCSGCLDVLSTDCIEMGLGTK
jgi:hypothetical protein